MARRVVQLLATGAALAAVLTGLARGWDFGTVLKRTILGYVCLYATGALLVALARIAMTQEAAKDPEAAGNPQEGRGTGGTNAAV